MGIEVTYGKYDVSRQILLEPQQHAALAEIAQPENRSISDVVREIVRVWLEGQDHEARLTRELTALEEVTGPRLAIQEERDSHWGSDRRSTCRAGQGV